MKSRSNQTVLCFDIGLKRTGVASGQTVTKTAAPAGQLQVSNGQFDWLAVDRLIAQWQPNLIVIGDPKSDNPHLKKVINRFKSHVQQQYKLPIATIDEYLTSSSANTELNDYQANISQKRKTLLRDQIAACLILEAYFNSLSNDTTVDKTEKE